MGVITSALLHVYYYLTFLKQHAFSYFPTMIGTNGK